MWDLQWDDSHTYGDVYKLPEIEHCEYAFNTADVERLQRLYELYEAEFEAAIARGLVIPAYDYVLKCSHTFNLLDTRGRCRRDRARRLLPAHAQHDPPGGRGLRRTAPAPGISHDAR